MITIKELKRVLSYNPKTGIWIWVSSPRNGWVGKRAGWYSHGYLTITINNINYRAHNLVYFYMTGKWPKNLIDHINGKKDDNRWLNLRPCNKIENAQNAKCHKDNALGLKGVSKQKDKLRPNPFIAWIRVKGKSIYLGCYPSAKEAHEAYCSAAQIHFGKYARLS